MGAPLSHGLPKADRADPSGQTGLFVPHIGWRPPPHILDLGDGLPFLQAGLAPSLHAGCFPNCSRGFDPSEHLGNPPSGQVPGLL